MEESTDLLASVLQTELEYKDLNRPHESTLQNLEESWVFSFFQLLYREDHVNVCLLEEI
jgi:hypothetical protein